MIFFLNTDFDDQDSVIEQVVVERALLFRQFHQHFQFLIRDWNSRLHSILNDVGIQDGEFVDLFDYYQGTRFVTPRTVLAQEIDFGLDQLSYQEDDANNCYLVTHDKQLVGRINLFPANATGERLVQSVEQLDTTGNLYKVDCYDERGFISRSQWYATGNQMETECWFNLDGVPVIEHFHRINAVGNFDKSGWRLYKRDDSVHVCDTLDQLYSEFVNDMNTKCFNALRPNIFVFNQPDQACWVVPEWRQPAYSVGYLQHTGDSRMQSAARPRLNNQALHDTNLYDLIVTATDNPYATVSGRVKLTANLFTVLAETVLDYQLTAARMATRMRRIGSNSGPERNQRRVLVRPYTDVRVLVKRSSEHCSNMMALESNSPENYVSVAVWHRWQVVLADAERRWPDKLAGYYGPVA